MAPATFKSLRLVFIAVFLGGASITHAVMYKWVEENGSVTYSNQPPSEPAKVSELTKIEEPVAPPTPETAVAKPEAPAPKVETARPETAAPQPGSVGAAPPPPAAVPETVTAKPDAAAPRPETVTAKPEPPAPRPEVVIVKPQTPGASTEIMMANPAPEPEAPRRVIPRLTHTEAVQDPCLTSADRNCPQKNAAHYSRYGGYSPTPRPQVAQPGVTPVGATSGAAAGGSVSGGKSTIAPPNWIAPVTPAKPEAKSSRSSRKTPATSTSEVR